MDTAIEGGTRILTPSTIVNGDPTTFYYENGTREYSPKNFERKSWGDITIREALAHSVNVAAVHVAEMVGYENVRAMAMRAGMNDKIQATPAVALGSYDITPLEAAGAYTVFANGGEYVKPNVITLVRSQEGNALYKDTVEKKQVLDPRVAYLMTNMMEEVLRSGTAAGVRAKYKFDAPAAGKTGTSDRDGWFAGYTSELLCIVWVGFDDSRDLDREGAQSAAPIWAEFMKRALNFREYRDTKPFRAPDGIVTIDVDPLSGMPATPQCPNVRPEVYIAGTQPVGLCALHGGRQGITNITAWSTEAQPEPPPRPSAAQVSQDAVARRASRQIPPDLPASQTDPKEAGQAAREAAQEGKLLRRILGVFK